MKIVILNSILTTPEKGVIPVRNSIKDAMIYRFALAFHKLGHQVTLVAAKEYAPASFEEYPFEVIFFKSNFKCIFKPTRIPLHLALFKYLLQRRKDIDLVISSEVFAFNSLIAALLLNKNLIIWHELALYNRLLYRLPALIWYHLVAKVFFSKTLIVGRSEAAKKFIKKHLLHVSEETVGHGIELADFAINTQKEDCLLAVSQLIPRKNVKSIILKFNDFIKTNASFAHYKLYVVGAGAQLQELQLLVHDLHLTNLVIFTGQINHQQLAKMLGQAKCLLMNSLADNSVLMVSEALAVATPILTNSVIDNSDVIIKYKAGIVKDNWDHFDIVEILNDNDRFINNCIASRSQVSCQYYAEAILTIFEKHQQDLQFAISLQ